MNYKYSKLYYLLIIAILFGCSSNKKEAEVKPLNVKVKGELSTYIEVTDGTYKVVKSNQSGKNWEISFKLKNIESNPLPPFYIDDINNGKLEIDFKLTLTDESGKPINGLKEFWMSEGLWETASELSKLKALLKDNKGTEEWFTLAVDVDNPDFKEKLPEGISRFTIRTIIKEKSNQDNSQNTSTGSSESWDNKKSSEFSGDCDAALTEYEQFVDDYIDFAEKASEGDLSVMTKAPSLMQKAESAGRKIQNMGQEKLGSTCWEKYLSIQLKLSNAALKMTKNLPKNLDNIKKQMEDIQNQFPK